MGIFLTTPAVSSLGVEEPPCSGPLLCLEHVGLSERINKSLRKIATKSMKQAGSRHQAQEESCTHCTEPTIRQRGCSERVTLLSTFQRERKREPCIDGRDTGAATSPETLPQGRSVKLLSHVVLLRYPDQPPQKGRHPFLIPNFFTRESSTPLVCAGTTPESVERRGMA